MGAISTKQLLEADVHFGHQTRRWDPKMIPYIYTERNGICIIDLQKFVGKVDEAYKVVPDIAAEGGTTLLVGTKKQAQETTKAEAERCDMYSVNERWLGGTLTNFKTIQSHIARLKQIETMPTDGTFDVLPKKEVTELKKEWDKLERNLGGIKDMKRLPDAIFIIDPKKEHICVQEAHTLGIPLVGIVDTNCDPEELDYVIPGNDDAIRAAKLIVSKMADAVIKAKQGEVLEGAMELEIPAQTFEAVEAQLNFKTFKLEENEMAAVTAATVKELREVTGAGVVDCKKTLAATDGDMDKAVEFLREKGLAGVAKKVGRIAAEGIVATILTDDHKKVAVVEVNAETDFVAKNEKFQIRVAGVAAQALNTSAKDLDAFLEEKWAKDELLTMKEALASQTAIIGENMSIRRFEQVEEAGGFVASYIHTGGKIGVLIDVETDVVNDATTEMAKDVAMQAAVLKPMFTNKDEASAKYIAKETETLTAAARNEKPDVNDKIIEGMVKDRVSKELKETCLLNQVYVKAEDGKQSVSQYVAAVAKENGANTEIKKFVRSEIGEGLERKNEDFVAEVAKQMGM